MKNNEENISKNIRKRTKLELGNWEKERIRRWEETKKEENI